MQESYENTNYNILISKENPHPLSGKNPLQNTPNLQKNTVPSEQPPPTHEISGKSQEIDSQKANSTVPSTLAKSQSDKITENSSILFVSQRISTIKDADEIIVLDNGEIIDKGTHDDLINRCEIYSEIASSQMEDSLC